MVVTTGATGGATTRPASPATATPRSRSSAVRVAAADTAGSSALRNGSSVAAESLTISAPSGPASLEVA